MEKISVKRGFLIEPDSGTTSPRPVDLVAKINKRHFKKGEFCMIHLSLPELVLNHNYSGLTYRVLLLLITRIDYHNRIKSFRQEELAQSLGADRSNISRCLKTLEKDEIIFKDGLDYYFSDQYVKGAGDTNKQMRFRKRITGQQKKIK